MTTSSMNVIEGRCLANGTLYALPDVPLSHSPTTLEVAAMVDKGRAGSSSHSLLAEVGDQRSLADASAGFALVRSAAGEALASFAGDWRPVAVFGDYDADGICSSAAMATALAWLRMGFTFDSVSDPALRLRQANVFACVPERIDGYGLSVAAVRRLHAAGFEDVVCVDNGTSAVGALEWALQAGMRVVVVDHHPADDAALAYWAKKGGGSLRIANPMVPGEWREALRPETSGSHVCAAMMVHAVSCEAASRLGMDHADLPWTACLAGFASVTDMMPVVGVNRLAVRNLLAKVQTDEAPPAVRALAAAALVKRQVETDVGIAMVPSPAPADLFDIPLGADFVGFDAGPKVNACGRMGQASTALSFMLSGEDESLAGLETIDGLNEARKGLEGFARDQALAGYAACADAAGPELMSVRLRDVAAMPAPDRAAFIAGSVTTARVDDTRACFVLVPGVICVSATEGADGGVVGLVASRVSRDSGLVSIAMNLAPANASGSFTASASGRVPEGSDALGFGLDTGILLSRVAQRGGGGGGGHAAAFGLSIPLSSGDALANLARIREFAVECALAIASEAAASPSFDDVIFSVDAGRPVDLLAADAEDAGALTRAVVEAGPYGHEMRAPLVGIPLPPSGLVALGKSGTFEVRHQDGRRPIKMVGFANSFRGGLQAEWTGPGREELGRGGVIAVGTLVNSFYGRANKSRWRGPTPEFLLEALVRTRS